MQDKTIAISSWYMCMFCIFDIHKTSHIVVCALRSLHRFICQALTYSASDKLDLSSTPVWGTFHIPPQCPCAAWASQFSWPWLVQKAEPKPDYLSHYILYTNLDLEDLTDLQKRKWIIWMAYLFHQAVIVFNSLIYFKLYRRVILN